MNVDSFPNRVANYVVQGNVPKTMQTSAIFKGHTTHTSILTDKMSNVVSLVFSLFDLLRSLTRIKEKTSKLGSVYFIKF